jgi:hypothetical protein
MIFNRLACLGALLLGLVWAAPVMAQSSELYIVRGVPVDATSTSATEAQKIAIAGGRAAAFQRLFRRLTKKSDWQREPKLDAAKLDALVQSFSVANERRSSTRYLADITYTFSPNQVRQTMSASGVAFSEARAKPYIVLPILAGETGQVLFGGDNPWAGAWEEAGLGGELAPILVPQGDVEDLAITPAVASAGDWAVLGPYAQKYEAGKIIVATATPSAAGLDVAVKIISDIGQSSDAVTVAGQPGEELNVLFGRAIAEINARLQEEWKSKTAVMAGAGNELSANILFSSLSEWAGIRARIQGTSLVNTVSITSMTTTGAVISIRHQGSTEQLSAAMAENGLSLTRSGAGWTISMVQPTALPPQTGVPSEPTPGAAAPQTTGVASQPQPEPQPDRPAGEPPAD